MFTTGDTSLRGPLCARSPEKKKVVIILFYVRCGKFYTGIRLNHFLELNPRVPTISSTIELE